jgi:tRNA modification GTPase
MRQKSKDTIAAQATPSGQAGIGLIRVSGPLALKIADSIFSPKRKGGRRRSSLIPSITDL